MHFLPKGDGKDYRISKPICWLRWSITTVSVLLAVRTCIGDRVMDYNGLIPVGMEIPIMAIAVFMSLVVYLVLYFLFGYYEQEDQVLTELDKACKGAPEGVDPDRVRKIKDMNIVYKVAIPIGTIIGSLLTYGLMATWVGNFIIDYFHGNAGLFCYLFATAGVAIGIAWALDALIIHPVADRTFTKVWNAGRKKLYEATKALVVSGGSLPNVSLPQNELVEALEIGISKCRSGKD